LSQSLPRQATETSDETLPTHELQVVNDAQDEHYYPTHTPKARWQRLVCPHGPLTGRTTSTRTPTGRYYYCHGSRACTCLQLVVPLLISCGGRSREAGHAPRRRKAEEAPRHRFAVYPSLLLSITTPLSVIPPPPLSQPPQAAAHTAPSPPPPSPHIHPNAHHCNPLPQHERLRQQAGGSTASGAHIHHS
jgi:hypothetical protein